MFIIDHSYTRSTWTTFHSPSANEPTIIVGNAHVVQSVTEIDSLEFDIYPNNVAYNLVDPYHSFIRVTDTDLNNKIEFEGRVIGVHPTMDEDGLAYKHVVCESCEAFLLDTTVNTAEISTTDLPQQKIGDNSYRVNACDFLQVIIDQHNDQVDGSKTITLGTVNIPATMTYDMERAYGSITRDLLLDFIKTLNQANNHIDGIVVVYYQLFTLKVYDDGTGDIILDIVDYWNNANEGTITIGSNMGGVTCEPDFTDVVTCVRPFGDEYSFNDGTDHKFRLTLRDYLNCYTPPSEMQALYQFDQQRGIIRDLQAVSDYGDITRPLNIEGLSQEGELDGSYTITSDQAQTFIERALIYLSAHNSPTMSISVTAYDLSYIGWAFTRFGLYQNWTITNSILGITENLPIVKRTINFDNPAASTIEFGKRAPRESDFQRETSERLDDIDDGANKDKKAKQEKKSSGSSKGGGDTADFTQYIPNWDNRSGAKPSTTNIIADFETQPYYSFSTQFYANELAVPARTIAKALMTVYYASIVEMMSYTDTTIGNVLAYVCGKYVRESEQGLLGMPFNFTDFYRNIRDLDASGELTWDDVAPWVSVGVIAYRKSFEWPWVCAMPYVVTEANYECGGEMYNNNALVCLDAKPFTSFQWLNTSVQHPTEGRVELAWVLVSTLATWINYTSAAVGNHSNDNLSFRVISVNNAPPPGADPTSFTDKGVMGVLHDDTYGRTTYANNNSLQFWGHSMCFSSVMPSQAKDGGSIMSTGATLACGRNIDTGALVQLDTTVKRFVY